MKMKMLTTIAMRSPAAVRMALLGALAYVGLLQSPHAHADTMLLASTDLVAGSSADTFSFTAPSAGQVTAALTGLNWPAPLSAMSFSATSASTLLSSWSGTGTAMTPQLETFQVGSGTYYAHVNATAGGPLDLGLYSLLVTFSPSAVPLPNSMMLLMGMLVLFGLIQTLRVLGPSDTRDLLRPRGAETAPGT
jgi:hypothetical protein